jgi:hypothetical protein
MSLLLGDHDYCELLANYLRDSVNEKYSRVVANNPSLPGQYVINGVRYFDDPSVPLSEFPLLKVYRNTDIFDGATPYRTTQATITYSVAYPSLDELPDLLSWMSFALNKSLVEFSYERNDVFDLQQNNRRTFQHLLMFNDVINAVHPFLRTSITFKDSKIICFDNQNP